jgi:hypothetical protein
MGGSIGCPARTIAAPLVHAVSFDGFKERDGFGLVADGAHDVGWNDAGRQRHGTLLMRRGSHEIQAPQQTVGGICPIQRNPGGWIGKGVGGCHA